MKNLLKALGIVALFFTFTSCGGPDDEIVIPEGYVDSTIDIEVNGGGDPDGPK